MLYRLTLTESACLHFIKLSLGFIYCGLTPKYCCRVISVPLNGGASVHTWYSAYCFGGMKPDKEQTCSLQESDLAPMVDSAALPSGSFDTIPTGAFSGDGSVFATGNSSAVTGHVVWMSDWEAQSQAMYPSVETATQAPTDCGAVAPKAWAVGGGINAEMSVSDTIANVAPVFGSVALLGEAGKITAISTYRFKLIDVTAAGIEATLRGKPGEIVTLMVATKSASGNSYSCSGKPITIGLDGTASAMIPSTM